MSSSSSNNSKITAYIKESKDLFIPFQVIQEATNNFEICIGKGGYGPVYKGELLLSGELTFVAVKRLDKAYGQGYKEFLTEIQLLSRYKHPNLVSLVGFCDEAGENILVYEYAEHGSLDKHLSKDKTTRLLTWEQRLDICLDTARGLDYLHNRIPTNHRVIHRDIKSANILIDHDWKAMITDFGLSIIGHGSDSYLIDNATGTVGSLDPAYLDTTIITKESDVYSFGVVMFEVLCGRLGYKRVNNKHRFLAPLARQYYETARLNEIIDPYLKIEVDSNSLKRFSEIAYPCLLDERDRRLSMSLVVQKLEEMMPSSKIPTFVSSSSKSKITTFIKESEHLFIPFQVIQEATKNFTTVLGNGGYGIVYRGELLVSGKPTSLAVKRLDSKSSGQGFKEFLTEIQLLSRYKHPNIVSLLGFCDEAHEKILVYEYAAHGSLDKYLRGLAKTTRPLSWEQRISICLDAARGLDYLHNHIATNHRVIHRDIKSPNILIGHDWKAMIADLGLSKIGRANEFDSYVITNTCGTHGYCDPAYWDTGILTKESDVYSFGVVMFEVLCGRLSFMNVNNEHRFLDRLAQRYYKTGRLNEIIDPYLKVEVDSDSLKRFWEIAYPCLLNERGQRPSMGLVVQKLEEMMASSKLVAQGSSKDPSSSKPLHGPNSNEAFSVLGHYKTGYIRDIYTFGEKLQEVEFGTIYLCTEIATGIHYACKSISKRKLISKTQLEEVRREIQIMHHLAGHNNIMTIKGAYEDLLYVHIVMELCNGGALFDRIVQIGYYTEKKAAKLIKIIAGVVEACHSLGVIHRNLKPENFLLVNRHDDFSLKETNFRSSIFFKPDQIYTDIVGTSYYMAPEVVWGNYGPEADVWSAGVILYILLSGVPPFWAVTEKATFDQVLEGGIDFDSAPWPNISDSAKDLIRKMLCPRPSDRLTAYEVLSHPWLCENGVAPERLDPAVLSRLKQFSAMSTLKKMALRVIAESLSEDEIAGLREMFKSIDTDNNGAITFDELKAGLRKYGSTLEDIEIRDLMDAADVANSGTIDYKEFVAATIHPNKLEREEHLVAAFQYFDKDGSGYITVDELQQACGDYNMTDFLVEDIIREVDQDNDGRIGYWEFVAMMRKGNAEVGRRTMRNI